MSKRHKIFFAVSILLFAVLLGRMLFLAGAPGEEFRSKAGKISSKTGQLSAIRGRIFDRNDDLMAWSERCYDLVLAKLPQDAKKSDRLSRAIFQTMHIELDWEKLQSAALPAVLKFNLTANELAAADKLAERFEEFDTALRWERRCSSPPPELGEVRQIDGMEHGVSGWEKEFDHILKGTPGTFTVMLDRRGRWLNSTFRMITPPVSGKDVYLSEILPEESDE